MDVFISDGKNGQEYKVRNNYSHRGIPKLILDKKEDGKFLYIQFDMLPGKLNEKDFYTGYLCLGHRIVRSITFYIKNINA